MTDSNIQVLIEIVRSETEGITLRNQFILLVIEALIVGLFGMILRKKKNISIAKIIQAYLLVAYIGVIMSLTVFRRPIGSREGIVHLFIMLGFGIKTGKPSLFISAYSIYNILLFIPFGLLLALLIGGKSKMKGILIVTIIGFGMSLVVECIQLITGTGIFEVTDLLTNTAGSFIGALLYESFNGKQVSVS